MSDIFREIDEELRRDNFFKLWQRYGKYIVALALALVALTALFVGWRGYQLRQRQAEGVRYAAALELAIQGKSKDAADQFAAMASGMSGGRAVLVRFEEAGLDVKNSEPAAAVTLYDQIAGDGSVDRVYRDLAALLAGRVMIDTDAKAAAERLKPLTDADNPFHPTALELTAVADLKAGDKAAARTIYQKLADDLTAPSGLRARAAEMAAALAS